MPKLILVFSLLLLVAACQSNSASQNGGQSSSPKKLGNDTEENTLFSSVFKKTKTKSIELPPDLVGSANSKVRQNHNQAGKDKSLEVLPEVIGATVVSENGKRWLQVESAPKQVWGALADFWAAEQIDLVEFEPNAGLMETDWIATGTESGDPSKKKLFKTLFSKIVGAGVSFDKYKIRLERQSSDLTNIYVTHRSTEKLQSNFTSGQKITEWEWVEGEGDQEKVAQLLQIMVLIFDSNADNSV